MFSVLWPLASRLKQLAADRYGVRVSGGTQAALTALAALPGLRPGSPQAPQGLRALWNTLFSYEVPVGLRVRALWPVFGKGTPEEKAADLRPWQREGLCFSLLQVLLLLGVGTLLALPLHLQRQGFLDDVATRVVYLVIAGGLYAPFTLYTLRIAYATFLAPGEGAPRRHLPIWALVVPAVVFGASVAVTRTLALGPALVELAMAVSAGFLLAGFVAGEIDALRRGQVGAEESSSA